MELPQFIKHPEQETEGLRVNQTAAATEDQRILSGSGFVPDAFPNCGVRLEGLWMDGVSDPDVVWLMNGAVTEGIPAGCVRAGKQICGFSQNYTSAVRINESYRQGKYRPETHGKVNETGIVGMGDEYDVFYAGQCGSAGGGNL